MVLVARSKYILELLTDIHGYDLASHPLQHPRTQAASKLHLVEIHYADGKKTRYRYECSRCGQRFLYNTVRDQAIHDLLDI